MPPATRAPFHLSHLLVWLLVGDPGQVHAQAQAQAPTPAPAESVGIFAGQIDIGRPKLAGSAVHDSDRGTYTVTGGGANMWFTNDALHFVWKKISGDVSIAADISFPNPGGNNHRKACLIIRQDLTPGSAYADAALHGDGLTSLQYREAQGAMTREVQANVGSPTRLRLDKRGHYVSMSLVSAGSRMQPAGGAFRLDLDGPFLVGLGVCAHDDNARETALFSNLKIIEGPFPTNAQPTLISTLETITIASKDRRAVWSTPLLIEAPNWSHDGSNLVFNSKGRLYSIRSSGGEPAEIDTAFATRCNNDHGFSPDGAQIVISDQSQGDRKSRIYTLPASGGTPRLITEAGPSYWHGWSPDGMTLAYCAERAGQFDVYTIPVAGGHETRLTTTQGLDDGPEYSPDGKFIYFNSDRAGRMQIWRMKPDGSNQEAIIADGWNNWFAHPSPDGKWLVFLSYPPEVKGHPENRDVMLRIQSLATGRIEVLAKLLGGQGTINVPSWSPDSRRLAFVSYQIIP